MREYFKRFSISDESDNFVMFNEVPIPGSNSPGYFEVFKEFNISSQDFISKANNLFSSKNVVIPLDYNKIILPDEFAICVACCIEIEEKHNVDTSKILKDELIESKSKSGIRHATSIATIVLHYLRKGCNVEIPKEIKGQKNPDIMIDCLSCEVKIIDESSWTHAFNRETGEFQYDPETGKSKVHELSEDLSYDLGQFISKKDSGYKGIKQADLIFADLSLKSFGWLKKIEDGKATKHELPPLKPNRMIFFAKKITNLSGFSIDFQPELWNLIKETEIKHQFSLLSRK